MNAYPARPMTKGVYWIFTPCADEFDTLVYLNVDLIC